MLDGEILHAIIRSISHDVVEQSRKLAGWNACIIVSFAISSGWVFAIIVSWLRRGLFFGLLKGFKKKKGIKKIFTSAQKSPTSFDAIQKRKINLFERKM